VNPPTEWDQRYATAEHQFPTEPDPALVEHVAALPPGRAVDLGAGEGRNALWLASRGRDVTAVDLSSVALDRAAAAALRAALGLHAVRADLEEYLADGHRFDLVVVANAHPEPAARARLFAAAAGAVAPRGHLFVVGHHLDSRGRAGPPDPERLYADLAGAFPELELLELGRVERRRGSGMKPLVSLVAWAVRLP
jgi:SAM-dependent methyltransferase